MKLLCNDCFNDSMGKCSKGRFTYPKATKCVDFDDGEIKVIALPPPKTNEPKQVEFFLWIGDTNKKCIAYAYLP